ncbi:hypothetical protein ACQRXC_29255 (plasmid) [Niallia taxi]|uniref:hypothetical protein n=1 Tax=Niallia taxi TaxID=2499688 RepID=UPI003F6385C1
MVKARLSSKGQVTLPKTVRDFLDLYTGDYLKFTLNQKGSVLMEKSTEVIHDKLESINNTLYLLMQGNSVLTISGNIGSGKTRFASQLVIKKFKEKKIGIIQFHPHTNDFLTYLTEYGLDFTILEDIESIKLKNIDLILLDESHLYSHQEINEVLNIGLKTIILGFKIDSKVIGNHLSVEVEWDGTKANKNENDLFETLAILPKQQFDIEFKKLSPKLAEAVLATRKVLSLRMDNSIRVNNVIVNENGDIYTERLID